jgi:hypothetical protein
LYLNITHTSSNDCRKEPEKLQEEGPEEEGVSLIVSTLIKSTRYPLERDALKAAKIKLPLFECYRFISEEGIIVDVINMKEMLTFFYSAHSFAKKEWYNVHVPSIFDIRTPTLTPCNKTAGQSKFLECY